MDSNQFYLTLPSNSDPKNTASTFTTNLPRLIDLSGDWEVGLAEIIYANSWYNIAQAQNVIQFFDVDNNVRQKIKIPRARYQTINELIETINNSIGVVSKQDKVNYLSGINFRYDHVRKGCTILIDCTRFRGLKISEHLRYMLGFKDLQFINIDYINNKNVTLISQHAPDMLGGMHSIYVYCDIVAPQIVGNIFAPLLQVINVEGQYMDIVNHAYITPHYIPILKKSFNSIEILLKSDQDDPIPFEYGKSIVKLHFRRVLH